VSQPLSAADVCCPIATPFYFFSPIFGHVLSYVVVNSDDISNNQPHHYDHLLKLGLSPRRSPQTIISRKHYGPLRLRLDTLVSNLVLVFSVHLTCALVSAINPVVTLFPYMDYICGDFYSPAINPVATLFPLMIPFFLLMMILMVTYVGCDSQ
jgi:hypothetical protein